VCGGNRGLEALEIRLRQLQTRRGAKTGGKTHTGYTFIFGPFQGVPATEIAQSSANGEEQMTAKVSVEEVGRVAELAHLKLTQEETGHMLGDLNAILDYVAELNELDTAGVAPLAQISELVDASGKGVLRADAVVGSLDRAAVMQQAPETDQVFFKVPKVIER
jgi:aspartyl-tRNA(Asn)/glutamyl-tRNA(Gln) amidotransferase subunit C